jgi:protein SCO1
MKVRPLLTTALLLTCVAAAAAGVTALGAAAPTATLAPANAALTATTVAPAPPRAPTPVTFKSGVFDPPRQAPNFSLQGTDGQPLSLNRYQGKVVLLAFGYSTCTAVCPVTLHTYALAVRKLKPAAAAAVQVVYVTVDPERDTPARLKQFLANFHPTFIGGTGTAAQLEQVRKDYGVSAKKIPYEKTYVYDHSSFTYLLDRNGRIRALMPYGHSADDFVNDLNILLRE